MAERLESALRGRKVLVHGARKNYGQAARNSCGIHTTCDFRPSSGLSATRLYPLLSTRTPCRRPTRNVRNHERELMRVPAARSSRRGGRKEAHVKSKRKWRAFREAARVQSQVGRIHLGALTTGRASGRALPGHRSLRPRGDSRP